ERATLDREVDRLRGVAKRRADQVSILSHEVRTPLALIRGSADLLAEQSPGPLNEAQEPATRRAGPGPRHAPQGAALRRAALQPRCQAPGADARRDPPPAAAAWDHVDLRHARPGRGDDAQRPDRRDER